MKIISRKIHGIIDYVYALALGLLPWMLSFDDQVAARNLFVITAVIIILFSFFTNYESGIFKMIPYSSHLVMDLVTSVFLIASPLLFDFEMKITIPLVLMGEIGLLAVALSTDKLSKFSTLSQKRISRLENSNG